MNRTLAIHVIEELIDAGVEEFIICPGGRNAPLVNLISSSALKASYAFEERSAAFLALGTARRTCRPVAVITTSGTAAAELLPAVMEAYYSSVPLILVTADRPRRFRGTNAPQTAEQVGLYGIYAPLQFDLSSEECFSLENWSGNTPIHINVCFEEPDYNEIPYEFQKKTIDYSKVLPHGDPQELFQFFERMKKPLVIVNTLPKEARESTVQFLLRLNAPVYLEGVSGLRNDIRLQHIQIFFPRIQDCDAVLRIGGVPTHRIWRDLEEMNGQIQVLSITEHPFSGLSWAPFIYTELDSFLNSCSLSKYSWDISQEYYDGQRQLNAAFVDLMEEESAAEPSMIHNLSKQIPSDSLIYLGNGLPIRNWDLCANYQSPFEVQATRGLNGIDGQLACFFGLCEEERSNIAILGDLTTLYDFAAGWNKTSSFTLFVMNNGGGKIFQKRYESSIFQNEHTFNFEHFARFWKIPYQIWKTIPSSIEMGGLIELTPDSLATLRFWKKWESLSKNLESLCLR